jgi:hypothetical protein
MYFLELDVGGDFVVCSGSEEVVRLVDSPAVGVSGVHSVSQVDVLVLP